MKNNLHEIYGQPIRWQYFTLPIIFLISSPVVINYWIFVISLVIGKLDINKFLSDIPGTILICVFFALPFIVLAVFNRNHFGKVICVMNGEGIYYKGNLIKWSEIEKIEYEIQIHGRSANPRHNWCHAVIYTKKEEIALIHAPLFILSEAKKYCPGIDTKLSTSSKWLIGILIIMLIILPFAIYFKK